MSYSRSEKFSLLLAYQAGELSIGQMARLLSCDEIEVRELRDAAIARGVKIAKGERQNDDVTLTIDEMNYLRSMD